MSTSVPTIEGSSWSIEYCLPRIPPFYTLEKTRVTLYGISPAEAAKRISLGLKALSLDTSFDGKKSNALARGGDGVELRIQLYQGDDISRRGIVVEVQKKRGCSFRFHKLARAILRAARGIDVGSLHNGITPKMVSVALLQKRRHAIDGMVVTQAQSKIDNALESAENLLEKDRMDANVLGIESLVLLTDEKSSGIESASYAAKSIITNDDKFTSMVLSFLKPSPPCIGDSTEQEHINKMRHQALMTLANSLAVLARNATDAERLLPCKKWSEDKGLLSIVIDELKQSQARPHTGYQAMRCLNGMMQISDVLKHRAIELGAYERMEMMKDIGSNCHDLLLKESRLGLAQVEVSGIPNCTVLGFLNGGCLGASLNPPSLCMRQ
eukprot:CAMPEP_0183311180 /NCGR_PEP_ID=MMETSP0160_2-20130417/35581_1 /TAXON_ID=2839 ORGANISM="Odontella Sinensis, Strain Grunow 1884" /NCGR_SAMPLE_ID=MMETSP0160_2 /ASSEMBLY_ACC=CAM_ASM_000250 /LENGTH=381 /DNA_ID=CAMNT_0025475681 /DNA_START=153 /DNA_END=1295 /DNA_ORIENTATION=+